jgi:Cu/Ag efflux protein CusF
MKNAQRISFAAALSAALLFIACGGNGGGRPDSTADFHTDPGIQHFTFRGTPVSIDTAALSVTLDHEKIEGYMDAMVMPFHVENRQLLGRLVVGKPMLFTLRVANNTALIVDARDVGEGK